MAFSDGNLADKIAVRLTIRSGTYIDSVETQWNDGSTSQRHGGGGGGSDLFALIPGEVITSYTVWVDGKYTAGLQLSTSTGRVSRIWGQAKGNAKLYQSAINKSGLVSFKALAGFSGSTTKLENGNQAVSTLEPIWSTATPSFGGRFLYVGEDSKGGNGGNTFSDVSSCGNVSSSHLVQVSGRSGSALDALQFTYDNGTTTDRHGGTGGSEQKFTVPTGQYITLIKGRSGSEIDQIQFITNAGVESPVYGGGGGKEFVFEAPTKNLPPGMEGNMGLLGFLGRCGSKVDRLQPVWAPVAPITYEILSVTYENPGPDVVLSETEEPYGNNKIINNTPITKVDNDTYTKTYTTTYTHSFSEETSLTVGAELTFTIGTPELGQAGGTINSSVTNTDTVTTSVEQSSSFTNTRSLDLTTPPYSILRTRLSTVQADVADINWTGRLKVTFYNKTTQIYPVSGTLSGGLSTLLQVAYSTTPITSDGGAK